MGFRNAQLISQLASRGMLNVRHSDGVESISFPEFGVLKVLAESTADFPLDEEAKRKRLMPRTYSYGWLSVAQALGMTLSTNIDMIQNIGGKPRDLKKEAAAINRISRIVKKLESKGLIKCLKQNSYSKRLNSVWLLTIGDEDENRECEKYVRYALNLDGKPPDAQPQPNNGMPKHTARTVTPATPPPPAGNSTPNNALIALFKTPTKTMQQAIEHDKIEEQTTLIQEETEEEMYGKQINPEIEKFKREHDGLTPRQYFVKYGHTAPDIQANPQEETHDAWNNKN